MGASPRVSPFPDLRDCAALLQRAGFTLPVADVEELRFLYADPFALLTDLRAAGEANAVRLRERAKAFPRERPAEVSPPRRTDGVRELTVTSIQWPRRDRGSQDTYVPCLRPSGRWLEQHGFGIHARVVVKVERGRLTVTLKGEEWLKSEG